MKRLISPLFIFAFLTISGFSSLEGTETTTSPLQSTTLTPFTGKITKNRVRMRFKPTFDDQVFREMKQGEMVVVLGESDDFYAVQPPLDTKGYVYRTLILDNVVEGNKVNVRLKPDLESPILGQLSHGERVNGTIDSSNPKWMEINLPSTSRFYVSKDFVEKAGDAGLMARLQKKQTEGNNLLTLTNELSEKEIEKAFPQIQSELIKTNYEKLSSDYPEFPEIKTAAQQKWALFQETYLTKKLAYLEQQSNATAAAQAVNHKLAEELNTHKEKLKNLQNEIQSSRPLSIVPSKKNVQLPLNMTVWIPLEESYFAEWTNQTGKVSPQDYYEHQRENSFTLQGIIEPYQRPVKNKPGDYILTNSSSKLPVAFLYSTYVNLQEYVGKEVTIRVNERPNNHFAFPAYFVISVE